MGVSMEQWKTLRVIPSETTSMTIHQLLSNSSYEFMVLARNRLGDELYSSTVTGRTKGIHCGHHGGLQGGRRTDRQTDRLTDRQTDC